MGGMDKYLCVCGWVYDPEVGDPEGGIAPGTPTILCFCPPERLEPFSPAS